MPVPQITRREWLAQALLLAALLVVLFPGVFLRGERIVPGDNLFAYAPWKFYAPEGWTRPANPLQLDPLTAFNNFYLHTKNAIKNGEWPLWNPLQLFGTPLLANCQSAVFYPPRLLHLVFSLHLATTLFILLKLWLCGATAYWCGRIWRLNAPAARFLSVACMLGGYATVWCEWPLTDVAVWVPVLLGAIELALEGRYRGAFWATVLGGAMLLLAGHPESAFGMGLGLGLYFALRLAGERRTGGALWKPMAACAGGWALALALCAAQLLPFLEYLCLVASEPESANASRSLFLTPGMLVSFWIPRFYGTAVENTTWEGLNHNVNIQLYAGLMVWFGVMLLFTRGERVKPRKAQAVCLGITAAAALLAATQIFDTPLLARLPVLRLMMGLYYAGFLFLALPVLGALGIEHWMSRPRSWRDLAWPLALAIGVAGLVWLAYSFNAGYLRLAKLSDYVLEQVAIGGVLAAAGLAALAIGALRRMPSRATWVLLTTVLAVDLLMATRGLNPTFPERLLYPETALTKYLESLPKPCRVYCESGGVPAGFLQAYGIEELFGYDGLFPPRTIQLHKRMGERFFATIEPACAVDYCLHDPAYSKPLFPLEEPGRFEQVAVCDGIEVYRDTWACPRAFLVGRLEVVNGTDALFARMKEEGFDPTRTAVTDAPPPGPLPDRAEPERCSAEVTSRTATHVAVRAYAEGPRVLVLADAYYPGWEARVDGKPTPIFPVYHAFRGIMLEPGIHEITYTYFPWSLRIGLAISACALLGMAGYMLIRLMKHTRAEA